MSNKTTMGKRNPKRPALLRNPLLDENTSPAKFAVWTGHLKEGRPDGLSNAALTAVPRLPSYEQLEDRARRVERKIASWDRSKLEAYYVRTLLSAMLLRKSDRMLDVALPALNALAQQQASHKELHKTARMLAMYANMLLKPELARYRGYRKGGVKGSAERKHDAARQHERWHEAWRQYIDQGGSARSAASTLAPRFNVTPRAFREGIKKALARAER